LGISRLLSDGVKDIFYPCITALEIGFREVTVGLFNLGQRNHADQ